MNHNSITIIMVCVVSSIATPLLIIDFHDANIQIDYYTKGIKQSLSSEPCSELNASRAIYDPAQKNTWIKSESMIDEVYKEKCK